MIMPLGMMRHDVFSQKALRKYFGSYARAQVAIVQIP
jgi:hypothetical protein